MLIQKIFHIRLNLLETKSRLLALHREEQGWQDVEVGKITPDGRTQLRFKPADGFQAQVELLALPSENPCHTLFRSTGGDVEVTGLIEFVPIRSNVTEVQLTIDYNIKSPLHRLLDRVTASFDRFLNRQLRRIEARFGSAVAVS
jgi:hypothetical protein